MIINFKNKNIEIPVKKVSGLGKIIGLMFKKKTTDNLLFEFNEKTRLRIHSYFVFFDFLAIWLDKKNRVLEWKIIKSFTLNVKPKKSFFKLIEIPFNRKNKKIVKSFVGKRKI
jgi:uncharacterized membrane protein (UPF0127 family)